MDKKQQDELKQLCNETSEVTTEFKSLKDIKITLLDKTINPYKVMFDMGLQTWTSNGEKWSKASPELRFEVVKRVLLKQALPLALEAPVFSFQVENVSRAAFDQIARTRYGVVFASKGWKDDNLQDTGFMIPSFFLTDDCKEELGLLKTIVTAIKEDYAAFVKHNIPNWAARCVLPIYGLHNFTMTINFFALQQFCANRMQTTEMEDTVAVAWLLREKIKEHFPLLAEYLRPSCDWQHKDTTMQVNGFADVLGVPHSSDNRQRGYDHEKIPSVKWSFPCTDMKTIERECNIKVPMIHEWIDYEFKDLKSQDKKLFNDNEQSK